MKTSPGNPKLKDIPNKVETTLPDPATLKNLGGSKMARSILMAQTALTNSEIMSEAAQIAFKGIVTGIGAPTALFNAMLDACDVDVVEVSTKILEKAAGSVQAALGRMNDADDLLNKAVDAGVGQAINLTATIPVAGQIIKMAWNIGKTIADIVIMLRNQEDPKYLYPPSRFDPDTDRNVLNDAVLSLLRSSHEWDALFYPPGLGGAESNASKTFYFQDLDGGGIRIISANQHADRVGFVPGTATLHQAIEVLGPTQIIETGRTLLPSASQQCLWLWRHISRTNSPAAFTLHAERVGAFWQRYIDDMRISINGAGSSTLFDGTKKAIFEKYNKSGSAKIFGWGDGSKEIEYAPTKLMDTLRKRQLDFCDTLTVAYVDESFGALQDPAVKAKWKQRRKDLLEHPAVCSVDLSNVDDPIYLDEIKNRRKGHNCIVAHVPFAWGGSGPSKPPEIVDGFGAPDRADPPPRTPRRSGGVGGKIAIAGAALAGYFWLRKK